MAWGMVPLMYLENQEPDPFWDTRRDGLGQYRTPPRRLFPATARLPVVTIRPRRRSGLGQLAPGELTDRIYRLKREVESTLKVIRAENLVREEREIEYVGDLIGKAMNWAAEGDVKNATSVLASAERELANIKARIATAAQTPPSFFARLTQETGALTSTDWKKWLVPALVIGGVLLFTRR